ncbi:MAG: electron transfer flavoprotein subunit alpha/FixB family protein [Clostridiaceae bacterium]|jgi:electron transfer flavoprotein alpha subunit|nr:electron transfer flavoprotein subunit alpha/FixB family protein [Clostridiaceae bacterium]
MIISNDTDRSKYSNVWVVAEVLSGRIQPVTHELIGAARTLADKSGSQVWVVVMGSGIAGQAGSLFPYGADKVILIDDEKLSGFNDEIEAKTMERLISKYYPEVIIFAATTRGRALAPRVAVVTNCGLTADCTELGIDPQNGDLLQTRPAFGGNIMATIRSSNHRPQMATVRPRVMKAPVPIPGRTGEVITEFVMDEDTTGAKKILEIFHSQESTVNLGDAQIIIAGGRAMKGPKGFELLKTLAAKVNGAVGASRAAVDAGWISYAHQVGQTGQTVQTKVYIACGISGQIQHLVGMQSCDLIIAIDKNPDTPMMQMADIAIVGDLFEVIPEVIDELSRE